MSFLKFVLLLSIIFLTACAVDIEREGLPYVFKIGREDSPVAAKTETGRERKDSPTVAKIETDRDRENCPATAQIEENRGRENFPAVVKTETDSEREDFPAVVWIQVGVGGGTAFFIAPNRVVTNFHVIDSIDDVEKATIQVSSGKWHPIKSILALDAINDLAVLEVKGYESEHYYLMDHSIDSVKDVETAGFPGGKFRHSYGQALPVDLKDGNLHTNFQKRVKPGASGSPIFKGGKLIAIVTSGYRRISHTFYNMSHATSVSLLRELLSKPLLNCQPKSCIKNEIKRVHQLAEKGDSMAQYQLANMYLHGKRVEQDFSKAAELFTQAAEQGHSSAQYQLAIMHGYGLGIEQNFTKAMELHTLSAKEGNPWTQFLLAEKYRRGKIVEKNPEQAVCWYTQVAEMGHPETQYQLAKMHHKGIGVTKNPKTALYWYTQAAEQGHSMAQYRLAKMYYQGQGEVEQNTELAFYWAKRGEKQGNIYAETLLKEINENTF